MKPSRIWIIPLFLILGACSGLQRLIGNPRGEVTAGNPIFCSGSVAQEGFMPIGSSGDITARVAAGHRVTIPRAALPDLPNITQDTLFLRVHESSYLIAEVLIGGNGVYREGLTFNNDSPRLTLNTGIPAAPPALERICPETTPSNARVLHIGATVDPLRRVPPLQGPLYSYQFDHLSIFMLAAP